MSKVSLLGAGETVVTLKAGGEVALGQPVKLTADHTASACAENDGVIGVCVSKNKDYLGVQLKGYLRMKFTGSLNYGWQYLTADHAGGVKAAAASSTTEQMQRNRQCLVVDIHNVAGIAGILL